ncbi:uncharacterized protein SRT_03440 [Streptococcus troglodytae]|uniref:Uncharacterized protein n=1 Tax=Streptococcus troglodytae TaxID=1111760 RepID=A0A1L7LHC4_9STRE|nr:uncharacterized protein SRT_03440 [Streptococcus troglodytae]
MNNLLFVLGLGLAGIDPVGMILLIAMQAAGLSKKRVYLFGSLVLFGTVLLGFVLSIILGNGISNIAQALGQLPNIAWVWIYVVLIAALIAWGVKRLLTVEELNSQSSQKSNKGIYAAAIFMIYTAIVDPTFLAVLALSGQVNNALLSLLCNLIWVLISQSPLFLLILAVMSNKHHLFIDKFNAFYDRCRQPIKCGITGLIFLSALVLLIDLSFY